MDLPLLDFSHFTSVNSTPAEKKHFADALVQSFKEHGFVRLINHPVPEEVMRGALEWSASFFNMPDEEKFRIRNIPGPHPQRGWSCVGAERTAKLREEQQNDGRIDLTDEREHFDAGPLEDRQYPNRWPDEEHLPGFKAFISQSYAVFQETSLSIMHALELGLGLDPDALVKRCIPGASELRLNHYPAVEVAKLQFGNVKRTWPHTDFGIITLLIQDETGGLEMEDRRANSKPGSTFVPVPPNPRGQLVVNVSDTLQRWTNGLITAGLHQVSPPPGFGSGSALPERHSCVFFLKADRDTSVGPLAEFVTTERPQAYEDITALEYQRRMTGKLYR